jgi:hypothetical protein
MAISTQKQHDAAVIIKQALELEKTQLLAKIRQLRENIGNLNADISVFERNQAENVGKHRKPDGD